MRRNSFSQPTRLYAVRFRFYDAVTFRWLNRDPAGYVDSMNLYGYGFGSGIGWSDPFGLGDPFFAGGVGLDGEIITYDQIKMRGMDWFDRISNFFAGFADSMTFGATWLLREALGWNVTIDTSSGWYIAGEITELVFEIIITGGGAALRRAAAKANRNAVRAAFKRGTKHIARNGQKLDHITPLFGHPGGFPTMFPTGGLPAWIHSSRWNLRLLDHAAHTAAHRYLRFLERWFGRWFNWKMLLLRGILDAFRSWPESGPQPTATGVPIGTNNGSFDGLSGLGSATGAGPRWNSDPDCAR